MWTRQIEFSRPLRHVRLPVENQEQPRTDPSERTTEVTANASIDAPERVDRNAKSSNFDDRGGADKICAQIMAELATIKSRQNEWLRGLQQASIEIAIRAAEQLLSRRIGNGERDIQNLVQQAVSYFDGTASLTVYVCPDECQAIEDANENWPAVENIRFVADDKLQSGQCRVDAKDFDLLFDWQARLEDMRTTLLRRLNDARFES